MKLPAPLLASALLAATLSAAPLPDPGALATALTAARDEAEWPGTSVSDAARNLKTAENALRFVRDGITHASYSGAFQGAEGTLRTRTGNPVDKANLLAAILQAQGWEATVVSSVLPADARPHQPSGLQRPRPALEALRTIVAPHGALPGTRLLEPLDQERARLRSITKEVDTTYTALRATLDQLDWKPTANAAPPRKADAAFWVRARQSGGEWKLLSTHLDTTNAPTQFQPANTSVGILALTVESVGGNGQATPVLRWQGNTSAIAGLDLHLGWMPKDKRAKNLIDLQVPLTIEVNQWQPSLQIGRCDEDGVHP